jgi:hypothetical protein
MRKLLGFLVLFALGFFTGAYVLRVYLSGAGVLPMSDGISEVSKHALLKSLETPAAPECATHFI